MSPTRIISELRFGRGAASRLPSEADEGEPFYITDEDNHNIYVGNGPGKPLSKVTGVTEEIQAAIEMKANTVDLGTAAAKDVPASGNATAGQVVLGGDTRLSNSRTPTAHKSSHATGGGDALTPDDIGAATAIQGTKADNAAKASDYTQTIETGDLITKGPSADVRAFMDGVGGRPTLAEWKDGMQTVDTAAAINAALAASTHVVISGLCVIKSPIYPRTGCTLEVKPGGEIRAISGFDGDAMVIFDGITTHNNMLDWRLTGGGSINGNDIANVGVLPRAAGRGKIDVAQVVAVKLFPIQIGDPLSPSNTYEVTVQDTKILNKQGRDNDSASIGVFHTSNCSDCNTVNVNVAGYRTGFRNEGSNNKYIFPHAWTMDAYGPMVYAYWNNKLTTYIAPFVDTPSNRGNAGPDAAITDVYGFWFDTPNGSIVYGGSAYLNPDFATDNIATLFSLPNAGLYGSICGFRPSATSAKKWKSYVVQQGAATPTNINIAGIIGDGNVYSATSAANRIYGQQNLSVLKITGSSSLTEISNLDGSTNAYLFIDPTPGNETSQSQVQLFRNVNSTGTNGLQIFKGDGSANSNHYLSGNGDSSLNSNNGNTKIGQNGSYNGGHIVMGSYHLWIEAATGKLRIKSSAPSSDADGTIVGQQ